MSVRDFTWCLEDYESDSEAQVEISPLGNDPTFGIEVSPSKRRCLESRRPSGAPSHDVSVLNKRRGQLPRRALQIPALNPVPHSIVCYDAEPDENELEMEQKQHADYIHPQQTSRADYWLAPWKADYRLASNESTTVTDHQKRWRRQLVNMRGRALAYGPLSQEESSFFSISMDLPALLHAWTELWQRRRAYFNMTGSAYSSVVDSLDSRVCNFGHSGSACDTDESQLQTDDESIDLSESGSPTNQAPAPRYIGPYRVLSQPEVEVSGPVSPRLLSGTKNPNDWQGDLTPSDHSIVSHTLSRSNSFEMMEDVQYELPSLISDRSGYTGDTSLLTMDDSLDEEIYFDDDEYVRWDVPMSNDGDK